MLSKGGHIVVARHREDLQWLFEILRNHNNFSATVYNDGDEIGVPQELNERICIKHGDRVPCEPTKYTRYIIDNWDCSNDDVLVFLQGDPLYHNPTITRLFDHVDRWNANYQNLTLYPHPPSVGWGCSKEIENGTAPNITWFADDARVWCDTNMGEDFNGSYYVDNWTTDCLIGNRNITVSNVCNTLGLEKPHGNILKAYSAMFATCWDAIKKHPKSVWHNVEDFVIKGYSTTGSMTQKERACIIEYMWAVLLFNE